MITRFAPSPTGHLHLGHVFAAKKAFGFAQEHGGTCLLRIEDIDHTRCREKYSNAIFHNLSWLGFTWPKPARIQSQHMADYDAVISQLDARGLIYRCFKTRKELPSGLYRGCPLENDEEKIKLSSGMSYAWRLSMTRCRDLISESLQYEDTGIEPGIKTVNFDQLSDEILARKDIGTSYHVASCHDDAQQNITHIVRGADIAPLTPFHRVLQHLMKWPVPLYHHHALLKNAKGEKLSKRKFSRSIDALKSEGFTAGQVLDMAKP